MSKTASPRRKPWSRNGITTSLSRTILPLNQATRSLPRDIDRPSLRIQRRSLANRPQKGNSAASDLFQLGAAEETGRAKDQHQNEDGKDRDVLVIDREIAGPEGL